MKDRLMDLRRRYDPDEMFTTRMDYWVWKELEYCQDMWHCSGHGSTSGLVSDGCPCDCDTGYSGDMCQEKEEPTTDEPCLCFLIYDPVCVEGMEYSNSCVAECEGHTEWTDGPCEARNNMCEGDEDCEDTHWCRGLTESRCREYRNEGDSCNGNRHPDYHERCAEGLDCVYPDTPGLVGASGICTR